MEGSNFTYGCGNCPSVKLSSSPSRCQIVITLHEFVKVVKWNCQSFNMDLLKFFMNLSKLFTYFFPFAKENHGEGWPRFQRLLKLLLWKKGVDWVKALKPWVRYFGDTLYLTLPHRLEVRLALWARLAKLVAQLSFIDIQNSNLLSLAWGLHFLHLKLTLRLSSFITFMTGCGLKPWSKLAHLCWHILSVFKWNSFSSWFDCPAACILDECSLISLDKRDDQPVNSCSGKKTQKNANSMDWFQFLL